MFQIWNISWHVAKGYVLQCFWSSRDSSTLCFNILRCLVLLQPYVKYRPLCPIDAKIYQYPKISLLLALIKKYVDKNQIYMLFCGKIWLSWNFVQITLIFMKIKEFSFNSNASWEILNRTFFNRIWKYNGGYQVTMVTEKRISRMKRTFFIDNLKNMFVLSILQTVSGTSTPIKSYCIFDVLNNWKTIFWITTC